MLKPSRKILYFTALFLVADFARADTTPTPTAVKESYEHVPVPVSDILDVQEELPADVATLPEGQNISFTLKNIKIQGNTVIPIEALEEIYAPYIAQEIPLEDLFKIAGQITQYYREEGYMLSRAYVPVQEIEDGNVLIKVVEGYVSRVWFNWKEMDPDDRVKFYGYRIKKVKPITREHLERNLLLIRDLPGVQMSAILKPSEDLPHASELIINVAFMPLELSLDVNNDSATSMGRKRGFSAMTFNSLLGMNDQLGLYGGADHEFKHQKIIGGELAVPLNTDGLTAVFKADAVQTKPNFADPQHTSVGTSTTMSFGLKYPLILMRDLSWMVSAWFDMKKSYNQTYDNGKSLEEAGHERLRVMRFESVIDFSDRFMGSNLWTLSVSRGLAIDNARSSGTLTHKGPVNFVKMDFSAARLQNIGGGFTMYGLLRGQLAGTPLLDLERFNFGGAPFNHAYQPGELSGDNGFEGKIEVRYTHSLDTFVKTLQFFTYYDYGIVWNRHPNAAEQRRVSAPGMGAGVRVALAYNLSLNVDFGKPLRDKIMGIENKSRWYVGMGYNNHEDDL